MTIHFQGRAWLRGVQAGGKREGVAFASGTGSGLVGGVLCLSSLMGCCGWSPYLLREALWPSAKRPPCWQPTAPRPMPAARAAATRRRGAWAARRNDLEGKSRTIRGLLSRKWRLRDERKSCLRPERTAGDEQFTIGHPCPPAIVGAGYQPAG